MDIKVLVLSKAHLWISSMSWWSKWPFIVNFGEIPKKTDDVTEWRHHMEIFPNFCENVFKPRACTTDQMESIKWMNVENRRDGASDTRRQNCWQNYQINTSKSRYRPKTSPLPHFQCWMMDFSYLLGAVGSILQHWKRGRRGILWKVLFVVSQVLCLFHPKATQYFEFCQAILSSGVWKSYIQYWGKLRFLKVFGAAMVSHGLF